MGAAGQMHVTKIEPIRRSHGVQLNSPDYGETTVEFGGVWLAGDEHKSPFSSGVVSPTGGFVLAREKQLTCSSR